MNQSDRRYTVRKRRVRNLAAEGKKIDYKDVNLLSQFITEPELCRYHAKKKYGFKCKRAEKNNTSYKTRPVHGIAALYCTALALEKTL